MATALNKHINWEKLHAIPLPTWASSARGIVWSATGSSIWPNDTVFEVGSPDAAFPQRRPSKQAQLMAELLDYLRERAQASVAELRAHSRASRLGWTNYLFAIGIGREFLQLAGDPQRDTPTADEVDDALESVAVVARGPDRSGQGRGLKPAERRVVDRRAMEAAIARFVTEGWEVEDVHLRQPFDLNCLKDGVEMHVEVKGTITAGESVVLTRNEVKHARTFPHVALVVVRDIELTRGENPTASGGELVLHDPWVIDEKALDPIAYDYTPPSAP